MSGSPDSSSDTNSKSTASSTGPKVRESSLHRIRGKTATEILEMDEVTIEDVRACARDGVPEAKRAEIWLLLLGVLPLRRALREEKEVSHQDGYKAFFAEFVRTSVLGWPGEAVPDAEAAPQGLLFSDVNHARDRSQGHLIAAARDARSPKRSSGEESSGRWKPEKGKSLLDEKDDGDESGLFGGGMELDVGKKEVGGLFEEEEGIKEGGLFGGDDFFSAGKDLEVDLDKELEGRERGGTATSLRGSERLFQDGEEERGGGEVEEDFEGISRERSVNLAPARDPLTGDAGEELEAFAQDELLREEIEKDVVRTHCALGFFQKPSNLRAMCRVLFLFAKLNPGVRYVQGMNELIAPLYFVMRDNPRGREDTLLAETRTFYAFTALLGEVRDVFLKPLDDTEEGITGVIASFEAVMARHDPVLLGHLEREGVDPRFYGLRWFSTLLAREFDLPDAVRLWDSFFADQDRFLCMLHCCAARLILSRAKLLNWDLSGCLHFIQDPDPVDVLDLLNLADRLRRADQAGGFASSAGLTLPAGSWKRPPEAKGQLAAATARFEAARREASQARQAIPQPPQCLLPPDRRIAKKQPPKRLAKRASRSITTAASNAARSLGRALGPSRGSSSSSDPSKRPQHPPKPRPGSAAFGKIINEFGKVGVLGKRAEWDIPVILDEDIESAHHASLQNSKPTELGPVTPGATPSPSLPTPSSPSRQQQPPEQEESSSDSEEEEY